MFEDRESNIEEMVKAYKRRELDEVSIDLGLRPGDYPNKRAIAAAILDARERVEALVEEVPIEYHAEVATMEAIPEYTLMEEVAKEVEKVSPSTVRGKIEAIMQMAAEFNNYAAMFNQSVKEFQKDIMGLAKENQEYVKQFYG